MDIVYLTKNRLRDTIEKSLTLGNAIQMSELIAELELSPTTSNMRLVGTKLRALGYRPVIRRVNGKCTRLWINFPEDE